MGIFLNLMKTMLLVGLIFPKDVSSGESRSVTIHPLIIKLNEDLFFKQYSENKTILKPQKSDGIFAIRQYDKLTLTRLKKDHLRGKKPLNGAVLCLDEEFYPLDLIMLYSLNSTKNQRGEDIIEISGHSHLYQDNFSNPKIKCSSIIDMNNSRQFKFPLVFAKLDLNQNGSSIEDMVIKEQEKEVEDIFKFTINEEKFRIRSFVSQKIVVKNGDYPSQKAHISLVGENKELKLYDYIIYHYKKNKSDKSIIKTTYSTTKINTIGDFNGDGKLDVFLEYRFDSKHYPYKLLIQKEDGFDVINVQ